MIANELQAFKVSLDTLRNTSLSMDEIDETRMLQEESVQFITDLHKLFTHEFEQLQLTLQSIHMLSEHDLTRTKRSLLPFVGICINVSMQLTPITDREIRAWQTFTAYVYLRI